MSEWQPIETAPKDGYMLVPMESGMKAPTSKQRRRVPVIEPMDPRRANVYEHTPLNDFRYGEYPRYINSINSPHLSWKWERVPTGGRSQD